MTYERLQEVNATIKTTDIKGKAYAEVNQRIRAFRMLYPDGFIQTDLLSNENGICVFQATVGYVADGNRMILGTGTAYEKEDSTFINKTSYIENCETSAVGRALGMAGIGIDTAVASAEEVQNAINNQNKPRKRAVTVKTAEELYEYAKKLGWNEDVVIRASQTRFGLMPEELTEKQIAEAVEILKPKVEAVEKFMNDIKK